MDNKKKSKKTPMFEKEKRELLNTGSTQFVHDGLLFYVETGASNDYVFDIYSPQGEIDNDSPIDGGTFDGPIDSLFRYIITGNEHLKDNL